MRDSYPNYANWAFRAATAFGLIGFLITFSEKNISNTTLDNLMKKIESDQKMSAPIQGWYEQTTELKLAMQILFPFDNTSRMVSEFATARNAENTPERLLATLVRSIANRDIGRLRDIGLIQNLLKFSLNQESLDWNQWIDVCRQPVSQDIAKIIIQLQSSSPLRLALCQYIPALALADQNIESFPVWGRLCLNLFSVVDAILKSLQSTRIPNIVYEMRDLRRHLNEVLATLQCIAEFVALRRGRNRRN